MAARTFVLVGVVGVAAGYGQGFAQSDPSGFTTVINVPSDDPPEDRQQLGPDTQLNVYPWGSTGDRVEMARFESSGSTSELNVLGGVVGPQFRMHALGVVNLFSGSIGRNAGLAGVLNVYGGEIGVRTRVDGVANLLAGRVGSDFRLGPVATLNMEGGTIGDEFRADSGSTLHLSGGSIGIDADISSSGSITGGSVGRGVRITDAADLTLEGEFAVDGVAVPDGTLLGEILIPSVLEGVLVDGSVFIVTGHAGDALAPGSVTIVNRPLPPIDTTPMTIMTGPGPDAGLRAGQSLTLGGDATLRRNFGTIDAALDIAGGSVGDGLKVLRSDVTISGGTVGEGFDVVNGSTAIVTGGAVGKTYVHPGATLTIAGGQVNGIETKPNSFLNITGGEVDTRAWFDGQVAISGGWVGVGAVAFDGSEVTITGGSVGGIRAASDSTVLVRGGSVGGVSGVASADLTLEGSFFFDGSPLPNGLLGFSLSGLLTGVLADGSVFFDDVSSSSPLQPVTNIVAMPLPPIDTTPMTVLTGEGPRGLWVGQSLTLGGDATLHPSFAAVDATLNIEGGSVGADLRALRSDVTISGGTVGAGLRVYEGSTVELAGGSLGADVTLLPGSEMTISGGAIVPVPGLSAIVANPGSTLNVEGGVVPSRVRPEADSTIVISGGAVADVHRAGTGSRVEISGGSVGRLWAESGSEVTLIGSEFMLNGAPVTGAPPVESFGAGYLFTGTLADGSPFVFSSPASDWLGDALVLTSVPVPSPDLTPMSVTTGAGPTTGLRTGQSLHIGGDATLADHFSCTNASLVIEGGTIGSGLEAAGSSVSVDGGSIGDFFHVHDGSVLDISGGTIGPWFGAYSGSTVNLSGGSIGSFIEVGPQTNFNISGRTFFIDGVPVEGLDGAGMLTITDRSITLSGVLADGSDFSFELRPEDSASQDYFDPDATVTITLVGPPPPCACDWNADDVLNDTDFFDWVNDFFAQSGPQGQSDFNDDGFENDQDWFDFISCFFAPPVECQ